MTAKEIKHLLFICPYKTERTRVEYQFCSIHQKKCSEVIHAQECERFKRLMTEEMKKTGM